MINYKLAKELKDAGFLQEMKEGDKYYYSDASGVGVADIDDAVYASKGSAVKISSLSELIEACGERFGQLKRYTNAWQVMDCYDLVLTGDSPEEAVAKLWLKLQK